MKAKYRKCIFRKFPIIFSRIMGKRKEGGNCHGKRQNNQVYGDKKRIY